MIAENRLPILSPDTISSLVLGGDIGKLTSTQKVEYYNTLCHRIGLDPTTQPFKLLVLNGKQVLYADKGATQQLCKIYNISTEVLKKEKMDDIYIVTVRAKMPTAEGERYTDEDGAVTIGGLVKDALANALMKAVTKAKRRAVLALCGLGMLDESEIETIPNAKPVQLAGDSFDVTDIASVNVETIEVVKITDKEMHNIRDLLIDADLKEGKLLEIMKIEKLEDLPAADYARALNAIKIGKAKKQQVGAK